MSTTVRLVAVLVAKEGREADLETLLRGMTGPSRAEAGNLRYDLWRDADQPGRFVLDELYRDAEALAFHRATAHFQAYVARVGEVAASRIPMVLRAEDVA